MNNLKKIRKKQNLTQLEIGEILNINQQAESRLENSKSTLPIKYALILSEHFGLSLDEIYGITKEEQQAGIHATVKIDITPLEDDLLDVFREIGEKLGEPSQRAFIEIGKSILEKIS